MKPKGLFISLVLLAALGGLVWWSNKRQAAKPSAETANQILALDEAQLQDIHLKKLTGEAIGLRRDNGTWTMTEPKPLAADQDEANTLDHLFSTLNADQKVEDEAVDLHPYGLDVPTVDATVTMKDGKKYELLVGNNTLDNKGAYAKLAGDPRIFTIPDFKKNVLDKAPDDYRDKHLLTFDPDKLTRVAFQAKGDAMEFGKNGQNEWQIVKPRPLRADESQVSGLVDKLRDAKLDLSTIEVDAAKSFASATKAGVATLTDSSGTQTLEIRKDKDDNYYAKSSVVDGTWKTAAETGQALEKTLDDYRNKKLFDFGFSDPTKIELKAAAYSKSGDKWQAGGKTMDSSTVQDLVDKLRDLAASKFVEKGGGDEVFAATVTSNDGKRVEKVTIQKQGSEYFARREGEPSIYELDAASVDALQKAAAAIKEAQPETPAKK